MCQKAAMVMANFCSMSRMKVVTIFFANSKELTVCIYVGSAGEEDVAGSLDRRRMGWLALSVGFGVRLPVCCQSAPCY